VLQLETVGQAIEGPAGDRIGAQSAGEVRGLDDDTGLGIELHIDLDLVAGHDTGGLPVGVAETEEVAATHDGDPASPGVPVDRDGHLWTLASTECLDHLLGNFQTPHGLRRLDTGSKLHDPLFLECRRPLVLPSSRPGLEENAGGYSA
jgi:hypothetical protein